MVEGAFPGAAGAGGGFEPPPQALKLSTKIAAAARRFIAVF
jgi:hypothetical protein